MRAWKNVSKGKKPHSPQVSYLYPRIASEVTYAATGRMMAPMDVYILISIIFEYVPLHGKRNFENIIKVRILIWGDFIRLFGWAQCNHMGP